MTARGWAKIIILADIASYSSRLRVTWTESIYRDEMVRGAISLKELMNYTWADGEKCRIFWLELEPSGQDKVRI